MVIDVLNTLLCADLHLSKHFKLKDFFDSQTAVRKGIKNVPSTYGKMSVVLKNLQRLSQVLETVRSAMSGVPIVVTSGFRCPSLNKAVNGNYFSKHLDGLAADVVVQDEHWNNLLESLDFLYSMSDEVRYIVYDEKRFVHIQLNR